MELSLLCYVRFASVRKCPCKSVINKGAHPGLRSTLLTLKISRKYLKCVGEYYEGQLVSNVARVPRTKTGRGTSMKTIDTSMNGVPRSLLKRN